MSRRSHSVATVIAAVAAASLLVLAGCGGDDGGSEAGTGDGAVIRVEASSFRYEPDEIEIAAGEEVPIELTSTDIEHDLVVEGIDTHAVHAEGGDTERGELHIDEPGEYTFYCSIPGHRTAGMEGRLIVTD